VGVIVLHLNHSLSVSIKSITRETVILELTAVTDWL
jgi:hypothetical protein